jgi:hypothetical protein
MNVCFNAMDDDFFMAFDVLKHSLDWLVRQIGNKAAALSNSMLMFESEPRLPYNWPSLQNENFFGLNGEPRMGDLRDSFRQKTRRLWARLILPTWSPMCQEYTMYTWADDDDNKDAGPYDNDLPSKYTLEIAVRHNRLTPEKFCMDARSSAEVLCLLAADCNVRWRMSIVDHKLIRQRRTLKYSRVIGTLMGPYLMFDPDTVVRIPRPTGHENDGDVAAPKRAKAKAKAKAKTDPTKAASTSKVSPIELRRRNLVRARQGEAYDAEADEDAEPLAIDIVDAEEREDILSGAADLAAMDEHSFKAFIDELQGMEEAAHPDEVEGDDASIPGVPEPREALMEDVDRIMSMIDALPDEFERQSPAAEAGGGSSSSGAPSAPTLRTAQAVAFFDHDEETPTPLHRDGAMPAAQVTVCEEDKPMLDESAQPTSLVGGSVFISVEGPTNEEVTQAAPTTDVWVGPNARGALELNGEVVGRMNGRFKKPYGHVQCCLHKSCQYHRPFRADEMLKVEEVQEWLSGAKRKEDGDDIATIAAKKRHHLALLEQIVQRHKDRYATS